MSNLIKHKSYRDDFLAHVISAYVSVERTGIFKCDKCTKIFDNNRDCKLHKIVHIQEHMKNVRHNSKFQNDKILKPYKCPDCDVSFAAQSTLDEHSILHLPFPYICDCGIGYYKKEDLRCHIKLIHGTKNKVQANLPQNVDPQEEQVIPQTKPQRHSKPKSRKGTTVKKPLKTINPKKEKRKVTQKGDETNNNKPKPEWNGYKNHKDLK